MDTKQNEPLTLQEIDEARALLTGSQVETMPIHIDSRGHGSDGWKLTERVVRVGRREKKRTFCGPFEI